MATRTATRTPSEGVVAVRDELGPYRHGYLDGVEAWRGETATGGVQGGGVAERQGGRV